MQIYVNLLTCANSRYRSEIFITRVVTTKVIWYCIQLESTKCFKIYDMFFIILN